MSASSLDEIKKRYNFTQISVATWRNPNSSVLPARGGPKSPTISPDAAARAYTPQYKVVYRPPDPTDDEESEEESEDEEEQSDGTPEQSVEPGYGAESSTVDAIKDVNDLSPPDELASDLDPHGAEKEAPSVDDADIPVPPIDDKVVEVGDTAPDLEPPPEQSPEEGEPATQELHLPGVPSPPPVGDEALLEPPIDEATEPVPSDPNAPGPESQDDSEVPQPVSEPSELPLNDVAILVEAAPSADAETEPKTQAGPSDDDLEEAPDAGHNPAPAVDTQSSADDGQPKIDALAAEEHGEHGKMVSFAPGTPEPKPTQRRKKGAKSSKSKSKKRAAAPAASGSGDIAATMNESMESTSTPHFAIEGVAADSKTDDLLLLAKDMDGAITSTEKQDSVPVDILTVENPAPSAPEAGTLPPPPSTSQAVELALSSKKKSGKSSKAKDKSKKKPSKSKSKVEPEVPTGLGIDIGRSLPGDIVEIVTEDVESADTGPAPPPSLPEPPVEIVDEAGVVAEPELASTAEEDVKADPTSLVTEAASTGQGDATVLADGLSNVAKLADIDASEATATADLDRNEDVPIVNLPENEGDEAPEPTCDTPTPALEEEDAERPDEDVPQDSEGAADSDAVVHCDTLSANANDELLADGIAAAEPGDSSRAIASEEQDIDGPALLVHPTTTDAEEGKVDLVSDDDSVNGSAVPADELGRSDDKDEPKDTASKAPPAEIEADTTNENPQDEIRADEPGTKAQRDGENEPEGEVQEDIEEVAPITELKSQEEAPAPDAIVPADAIPDEAFTAEDTAMEEPITKEEMVESAKDEGLGDAKTQDPSEPVEPSPVDESQPDEAPEDDSSRKDGSTVADDFIGPHSEEGAVEAATDVEPPKIFDPGDNDSSTNDGNEKLEIDGTEPSETQTGDAVMGGESMAGAAVGEELIESTTLLADETPALEESLLEESKVEDPSEDNAPATIPPPEIAAADTRAEEAQPAPPPPGQVVEKPSFPTDNEPAVIDEAASDHPAAETVDQEDAEQSTKSLDQPEFVEQTADTIADQPPEPVPPVQEPCEGAVDGDTASLGPGAEEPDGGKDPSDAAAGIAKGAQATVPGEAADPVDIAAPAEGNGPAEGTEPAEDTEPAATTANLEDNGPLEEICEEPVEFSTQEAEETKPAELAEETKDVVDDVQDPMESPPVAEAGSLIAPPSPSLSKSSSHKHRAEAWQRKPTRRHTGDPDDKPISDRPKSSSKHSSRHVPTTAESSKSGKDRPHRSRRRSTMTEEDIERRRRREARKTEEAARIAVEAERQRVYDEELRRIRHEARQAAKKAAAEEMARIAKEEGEAAARREARRRPETRRKEDSTRRRRESTTQAPLLFRTGGESSRKEQRSVRNEEARRERRPPSPAAPEDVRPPPEAEEEAKPSSSNSSRSHRRHRRERSDRDVDRPRTTSRKDGERKVATGRDKEKTSQKPRSFFSSLLRGF